MCHALTNPCPKLSQPETPQVEDDIPSYVDLWEVPREDIELKNKLGKGLFGEVYRGLWKKKVEVSVKVFHQETIFSDAFVKETAIMKQFRHANLITLFAVCSQEEPVYLIQEYMSKGCLLHVLKSEEGKSWKFRDLADIARQVWAYTVMV